MDIASEIRERIDTGRLPAHGRAPTVTELEAEFGIATATAMQVLRQLDRWGLVVRRRRVGSWVRSQPPRRLITHHRFDRGVRNAGPTSYEREVAEAGYRGEVQYVRIGWGDADERAAHWLGPGVEVGDPIVVRDRVMWATPLVDGEPVERAREVVQLMCSVFPRWVGEAVPAILQERTGPGGSYSRIDDVLTLPGYGHGLVDWCTEHIVPSRLAEPDEAEKFGFERTSWITDLHRVARCGGEFGVIVEVARALMLPDLTEFSYGFPVGD